MMFHLRIMGYFLVFFASFCSSLVLATSLKRSENGPAEKASCEKILEATQKGAIIAKIEPKFGLEWEGALAIEKGNLMDLSEAIAKRIETLRAEESSLNISEIKNNGISVTYKRGKVPYKWELTIENSILVDKTKYVPFELVSPVLHDQADKEIFRQIMNTVVDFGVKARPNSSAIHTHVSANFQKNPQLAFDFIKVWQLVETVFLKSFPISNTRKFFTQPMSKEIYDYVNKFEGTLKNVNLMVRMAADRNRSLNVKALFKHKTLEVRIFNSSADKEVISFCLDFVSSMFDKVLEASANPAELKHLLKNLEKIKKSKSKDAIKLQEIFDTFSYKDISAQDLLKKMKNEVLESKVLDKEGNYQDSESFFTTSNITITVVFIIFTAFSLFSFVIEYLNFH